MDNGIETSIINTLFKVLAQSLFFITDSDVKQTSPAAVVSPHLP
jgi:hypothetical protein